MKKPLYKSIFPHTAAISDGGHLLLGGCDVADLAKEYDTPLYVFDEDTIRNLCSEFLTEFQKRYSDTRVIYASKAFLNRALIEILVEEGLGIDVVSGGELHAVRLSNMPASNVYFHGNNKSRYELDQAVGWGVGRVVVDNLYELELLQDVALKADVVQDILIRVTPGVDAHTHTYISTGTLDSKFGFPIGTGQALEAIKQSSALPNLRLIGLHCHIGSQIFEMEPYGETIRIVMEFAAEMYSQGLRMQEFSVGGGFGIRYTRDETPPSIASYAEVITTALISQAKKLGLPLPTLAIEPGRAIAGPAGVSLYTVGSHKVIPGVRTYVSVDGGMGDNIRPALYQSKYEAVVANQMNITPSEHVTIAGKFCESGDILVWDVDLPPTQPGDLIALPASGAYCIPMASNYNMSLRPAIVMVRDGNSRLVRRRETYDALLDNELI